MTVSKEIKDLLRARIKEVWGDRPFPPRGYFSSFAYDTVQWNFSYGAYWDTVLKNAAKELEQEERLLGHLEEAGFLRQVANGDVEIIFT